MTWHTPRPWLCLVALACGGGSTGSGDDDDDDDDDDAATTDTVTAEPLDCAWFEGDNCWRDSQDEVTAKCQPPDEQGLLDPSHTSCTFSDGTRITFGEPLNLDGDGPEDWDLSIIGPSGTTCRIVSDDEGLMVSVDGSTTRQTVDGMTFDIECPDGSVHGPGGLELIECGLENLPGTVSSWTSTAVSFGFLGDGLSFFCAEDS